MQVRFGCTVRFGLNDELGEKNDRKFELIFIVHGAVPNLDMPRMILLVMWSNDYIVGTTQINYRRENQEARKSLFSETRQTMK